MATEADREGGGILGPKTLLPASVFIAAAGLLLGFGLWLNDRFNSLDKRMTRLEDLLTDQWTITQQELWSERLGRNNPEINVPPVRR